MSMAPYGDDAHPDSTCAAAFQSWWCRWCAISTAASAAPSGTSRKGIRGSVMAVPSCWGTVPSRVISRSRVIPVGVVIGLCPSADQGGMVGAAEAGEVERADDSGVEERVPEVGDL